MHTHSYRDVFTFLPKRHLQIILIVTALELLGRARNTAECPTMYRHSPHSTTKNYLAKLSKDCETIEVMGILYTQCTT
jgi:hypothetical protein